jgi:hypothetical protein
VYKKRRIAIALAGIALLLAFIVVGLLYVRGNTDPKAAIAVISTVVGLATLMITTSQRLWRWGRPQAAGGTPEQLADAAAALAEQLHSFWGNEAQRRRITTSSMVVNWQRTPRTHGSQLASLTRKPPDGIGPKPIPGPTTTVGAELPTKGVVTLLHDLYSELPYGRLVILGDPGAGKTSAAILLLLAALAHREADPAVPVPVLLTLDGWEPNQDNQSLRACAIGKIDRDHKYLRENVYGPQAVERLIDSGRIALFLDGLDEMPEAAQAPAMRRITEETELRIVLMSRPAAYENAVSRNRLQHTAIIELRPVDAGHAAAILADIGDHWNVLATHLRTHPSSPAAQALNTPLTLSLVQTVYLEAGDPSELADSKRFPTPESIRVHLLDGVLAAAYTDPRRLEQARRWLGYLAHHMNREGDRDLAWWRITAWTPWLRWPGALVLGLVVGLTGALVAGLVGTLTRGLVFGRQYGLGTGIVGWLTGWLYASFRIDTVQPREIHLRRPTRGDLKNGWAFSWGLAIGASYWPLFGLRVALVVAVMAGLVTGLGGILAAAWIRPAKPTLSGLTPQKAFSHDLRTSLVLGVGAAIGLGLVAWLLVWFRGPGTGLGAGLLVGLVAGALAGPAIGLLSVAPFLYLRGLGPPATMRFLEVARNRQVLRQAGAVYQFRHADVQDRLAAQYDGRQQY